MKIKSIIILFLLLIILAACNNVSQEKVLSNYAILSGSIKGKKVDTLILAPVNDIASKKLPLSANGTFIDTVRVDDNGRMFKLIYGDDYIQLFLKKSYETHVELDPQDLYNTAKFGGDGIENNNFLITYKIFSSALTNTYEHLDTLTTNSFYKKLNKRRDNFNFIKNNTEDLDPTFVILIDSFFKMNYDSKIERHEIIQFFKNAPGTPSPGFSGFKNYAGGTTSSEDFKGKFVFIDLWATWCKGCKEEFPFLDEIEKKYSNKNIEFISISLDKPSDYEKWRNMVNKMGLNGIQLIADNALDSDFIKYYKVMALPRYILINPEGNIVSAAAPAPSNKELIDLFNEAGI